MASTLIAAVLALCAQEPSARGSGKEPPTHRTFPELVKVAKTAAKEVTRYTARVRYVYIDPALDTPREYAGVVKFLSGTDQENRRLYLEMGTPREDGTYAVDVRMWHTDGSVIITDERVRKDKTTQEEYRTFKRREAVRAQPATWEPLSYMYYGPMSEWTSVFDVQVIQDGQHAETTTYVPKQRTEEEIAKQGGMTVEEFREAAKLAGTTEMPVPTSIFELRPRADSTLKNPQYVQLKYEYPSWVLHDLVWESGNSISTLFTFSDIRTKDVEIDSSIFDVKLDGYREVTKK